MDDTEKQIARLRQIEDFKPRKGAIILVIPIISVIVVGILYVMMFRMGIQGRQATGERVTLQWNTCAEAQPILERRVAYMGLGDPTFNRSEGVLSLTVTLPEEPDVAERIPNTLVQPGVLRGVWESHPEQLIISNSDVVAAAMRQDLTLMPWTVLTLTPEAQERLRQVVLQEREGKIVYSLDGVEIAKISNLKGAPLEVELSPIGTDDRDRMHKAAERTVILESGPLPCALTPVGKP